MKAASRSGRTTVGFRVEQSELRNGNWEAHIIEVGSITILKEEGVAAPKPAALWAHERVFGRWDVP